VTAPAEPRTSVIEGSLREVALADVLQLLDLGRKTGLLRVDDARERRVARLVVVGGRVCGACVDAADAGDAVAIDDATLARRALATDARTLFDVVGEALAWRNGRFAVDPLPDAIAAQAPPGHGVDALLMDAARRADEWAALADRVAGPHVVPALAASDDAGALLTLSPDEWEALAYADGVADLRAIARRAGRDVLAVATAVHRLLALGLLAIDAAAVPQSGRRSSEG